MIKNKKIIYGGIVVVSGLLLYYLFKGKSPITLITGSSKKNTKAISKKGFDPIALSELDPNFKAQVKVLQTKLNTYLKSKFPEYPLLEVDGLLGSKTMSAIEKVFGDRFFPLEDSLIIKYFISQLN